MVGAAGLVLLDGGREAHLGVLLARLGEGTPAQRAGIRRALELSRWDELPGRLIKAGGAEEGELQVAALELVAFRGTSPSPGLERFLASKLLRVQEAALRAARGALNRVERRHVLRGLESSSPEVRCAALELGLLLGLREAWLRCRAWATAPEPERAFALQALVSIGGDQELPSLLEALKVPEFRRDVLRVLGSSGRVSAAEACLAWMREPTVARLAGEAFSVVTGLELEEGFALPEPEPPEELPPLEEDLKTELLLKPEDELPCPDAEAVEAWWWRSRHRFERQGRYFQGQPLDATCLLDGLEQAPMRRRPALAMELSLRSRGRYLVETRGFTVWQRYQMKQAREWRPAGLLRPLTG